MRNLIFLILLAILATAFTQKCPSIKLEAGKCNCLPRVKTVCGASGKTHVNKCIAKCFGDVVAYSGKCFKKCPRTVTSEKKCSLMPFGKFGIRKYCCSNALVCFGKICSRSNFQCTFSGQVIRTFPKRFCKWTKKGRDSVKKCCIWRRRCVGEVCKNSKKRCTFQGHIVRKSSKKHCQYKKPPTCADGLQRYCCKHSRKCIVGGKCTRVKKSGCKFSGPIIRRKIKHACKWARVGKHGKRRQCCATQFKCKGTVCKKVRHECKWIGWTYIEKKVQKCATRKYKKATRKRCCVWKIRCYNKKCTTINKSCGWKGAAVKIASGKTCKWTTRGKGKKQKRCCTFKKRCVNAKCKVFARKCSFVGKLKVVKRQRVCKLAYVAVAKAHRRQCCSFDLIDNKKKNVKCVFSGPFVQTKKMKSCTFKKINKVASCKYCCEWTHGCSGKTCSTTKKICRCASAPVYRTRTQTCSMKVKRKGVSQNYCCDFKQTCFAGVGKNCKASKKKCHYVGFPIITNKVKTCSFKSNKGKKQQYCCAITSKCQAGKCKQSKDCKWTGKAIVSLRRNKCRTRRVNGNSKRKFCCRWIDQCNGPICKKNKKVCGYEGPLYQSFTTNFKQTRKCGAASKGKRIFKCSKKRICFNAKPESCNPNVSKCLSCKETKAKCRPVGKCFTVSKSVKIVMKSRGKGLKQKWRCVRKTVCMNNVCKRKSKKCGWFGAVSRRSQRVVCTWKKDKKTRKERKFCCKEKTLCTGKICKQVNRVCAFTGPWRQYRKHVVCKYVPFKSVKKGLCSTTLLRKQCCHYNKKCVNNKCITQSKRCKYLSIIERTPKKKCSWKVISGKKCNSLKQKVCTTWHKVCVRKARNAKRVCRKENVKTVAVKNATVKVTCKRTCGLKFFGTCQKRRQCCTKQTVCYGGKCHSFIKKCVWKGAPTKCCRGNVVFRWRTVCREQNWKVTKTREQCCRVYQRCEKITNYYRCSIVKRKGCWWTSAARGDVHLLGSNGKWHTVNVAGTFKYATDLKSKVGVYLQFRQVGSGSDISAVTIQAENSIVRAVGGKVTIDGAAVAAFPAKVGKGLLTKTENTYVLTGFSAERVAFVSQKDGSYTVDVGVRVGAGNEVTGLIYDLKNPIKYQITEAQSKTLFQAFLAFKNIVVGKKHSKKTALKCCASIKTIDAKRYEQCVSDTMASGKCYNATYKTSNDAVKDALTKK